MVKVLGIIGRIYLVLLVILWLFVMITISVPKIPTRGIWGVTDIIISLIDYLGIILFVTNKKFLPIKFWKIFTVLSIIWDLTVNIYIIPMVDHKPFELTELYLFPFVTLPLYIALVLYSFRNNRLSKK